MKQYNSHFEREIPDTFSIERIEVSDGFANKVMDRIALEKAGGLSSLSRGSKIAFMCLIVLIYSSLGIFIGMQSHNNLTSGILSRKEKAIIELRAAHHLDPVSSFDRMLKPFGKLN